jgi:hypothetical protein
MTAQPHDPHPTPAEIRASLKADRNSPKTIRAALPPEDQTAFDRAYWHALDNAKLNYDLTPITECVTYWWWQAYEKADPDEYAETIARAERAMEYLERGESPPGARRWDNALDAEMRARIEHGK